MARVLIIDDSRLQRNAIVRMVKDMGHDVLEASNGKEGKQKICTEKPDCVMTDLHMPEVDGIGLVKDIKASLSKEIKIILMSANVREGSKPEVQQLEAFAFLSKPVQKEVLEEVLTKALNNS